MRKSNNVRIVNGRKIGDILGRYTCYKWNGCSVNGGMLSFKVLDILDSWSDHCQITINIYIYVTPIRSLLKYTLECSIIFSIPLLIPRYGKRAWWLIFIKTGNPFNTTNYRGLFVLNSKIAKLLEKNKLINYEQTFFRQNPN